MYLCRAGKGWRPCQAEERGQVSSCCWECQQVLNPKHGAKYRIQLWFGVNRHCWRTWVLSWGCVGGHGRSL